MLFLHKLKPLRTSAQTHRGEFACVLHAPGARVLRPVVDSMRPPLACDILPPLPGGQSHAHHEGRTLAYLFLLESGLPFALLWERYFAAAEAGTWRAWCHLSAPNEASAASIARIGCVRVPTVPTSWANVSGGQAQLVHAALEDPAVFGAVQVSGHCVPLKPPSIVWASLAHSQSLLSFDPEAPSPRGKASHFGFWDRALMRAFAETRLDRFDGAAPCDATAGASHAEHFVPCLLRARPELPVEDAAITWDCWDHEKLEPWSSGNVVRANRYPSGEVVVPMPVRFERVDGGLLRVLRDSGALFGRKFAHTAETEAAVLSLVLNESPPPPVPPSPSPSRSPRPKPRSPRPPGSRSPPSSPSGPPSQLTLTAMATKAVQLLGGVGEVSERSIGGRLELYAEAARLLRTAHESAEQPWPAAAANLGLALLLQANATLFHSASTTSVAPTAKVSVEARGRTRRKSKTPTAASSSDEVHREPTDAARRTALGLLDEARPPLGVAAAFGLSAAVTTLREVCKQAAALRMQLDEPSPPSPPRRCAEHPERLAAPHQDATVVLFSYHDLDYGSGGGQTGGGPLPGWYHSAAVAASTLRATHPHLMPGVQLQLASNRPTCTFDNGRDGSFVFDEHLQVDLLTVAQLPTPSDAALSDDGAFNRRVVCATKIAAMQLAFAQGYGQVVYLDFDTSSVRPWLGVALGALRWYDLAGVMEGYPFGASFGTAATTTTETTAAATTVPHDASLLSGDAFELRYELNTGVLALRASAVPLCDAWLGEFRAHATSYASLSSADQPALMAALRAHPQYRFFPLPPTLNFRPYAIYTSIGPVVPGVVHDRRLEQASSAEARRHVAELVGDEVARTLRGIGDAWPVAGSAS